MIQVKIKSNSEENKRIFIVHTEVISSFVEELTEFIGKLKNIAENNSPSFRILKMTVFVNSKDFHEFSRLTLVLNELIKANPNLNDFPVLFVAQPPANNKNVAVEIMALMLPPSEYSYEYESMGNISYCKVAKGGNLEIYGTITAKTDNTPLIPINKGESVYQQAMGCFEDLKNILEINNLDFQNIARQWGYIGGITNYHPSTKLRVTILPNTNEGNEKIENYQLFNMARAEYYRNVEWKYGYPAATGIGANVDGCSIEFIATNDNPDKKIIPLHNPKQWDAHKYTGKQFSNTKTNILQKQTDTPKFERGKIVISGDTLDLYVSGTAAIIGEDSVPGDIQEQTKTTLDNITKLCSKENLEEHGLQINGELLKFTGVRAYIKYQKDAQIVEKLCREEFADVPILCVIADVCREELLVEIEAFINCNIDIRN